MKECTLRKALGIGAYSKFRVMANIKRDRYIWPFKLPNSFLKYGMYTEDFCHDTHQVFPEL